MKHLVFVHSIDHLLLPLQATLKFSSSQSLPKGKVNLRIASSAKSLCALRAVDKSVQIGFEDKELTNEMVRKNVSLGFRKGLIQRAVTVCILYRKYCIKNL